MGVIYLVTNLINGKQYVGQTVRTMKERRAVHEACAKRASRYPFQRALKKHGFHSFDWCVIEESDDLEELNQLEIENIKWFGSLVPNGYNLSPGGGGSSGCVRSPEWREKVRRKLMGHLVSSETRKKLSEITKRSMTPERLLKMSLANKGQKRKPCSEETKAKIGAANRGRKLKPLTYEQRLKVGAAVSKSMTPEVRARLSESVKRAMTPEVVERIKLHSSETKRRYFKYKDWDSCLL